MNPWLISWTGWRAGLAAPGWLGGIDAAVRGERVNGVI